MERKAIMGSGLMNRSNCCVTALALLFFGAVNDAHADAAKASAALTDMRTEGVCQPMGVEEAAPRFSWRYEAGADAPRGFRQSAYRVQVASSAEKLAKGDADLWDSGKRASSESLSVLYAGKPLASATRCYWRVIGYDAAGKAHQSKRDFFEMGLLKAEDWQGAQWIGARAERPKTIPAKLQGLQDYTFETKFRISEGSAIFEFRSAYCWAKGYVVEIQPGDAGKLIVSRKQDHKNEVLKEYPLTGVVKDKWHHLRVDAKGADFSFWVNEAAINSGPLHNDKSQAGTIAVGASNEKDKKGLVQFDDFKLTVDSEVLVQEAFDHSAIFAFQDYFFSNQSYSRVKDGVLEVCASKAYLEPKEGLAAPLFRKSFTTESIKITRARAYVSGLGYYTFWLNGKRLDDYLLHPGFARYNKTAYYTIYDVTDHLKRDNTLAFELGRGWYGMTTPTGWGETFCPDWMAEPALRTLVAIEYADGSRQTVISDPSFKTVPGPILFDSIKAGEIYDARKEIPGWNAVGFNDQQWGTAVIAKGNMPSAAPGLTAQLFEPIRVVESFAPKSIEKIEDEADTWILDVGRHMAGALEIRLKTEPGQRLRVSYVERDRMIFGAERWNNFNGLVTGSFQTDTFISKGGANESFQPRYSYKGFRYVRIEGSKEKISPEQVTVKVINTDMTRVGQFTSSSDLWNKIWEAGCRSIQSNMHSIPTDCPTFEKLGWTCDDASPYYAMAYNYDLRKLYEKRLQDYADDITPDGRIRDIIPSTWGKGQDPAWGGSCVPIAWYHYQTYGDKRVIERYYDMLKLYMSSLIKEGETSEKPPLLTKPRVGYGDWVPPDNTNVPPEGALIYYNLYYSRYARLMAEMAKVIGRAEDEKYYSSLAKNLKQALNEYHFDEKDGFYYSTHRQFGFRQSPQAIALAFGLVREDKEKSLVNLLVDDIQQKRKGQFWVGILGMEAIADALTEYGRADLAYSVHLKDVGPTLGMMIREGATTIWEGYGINQARSLNHKMFATPLGWMARYVAGLQVDGILGNGPGFREAVIAPYPCPDQVTFAKLDYDSPLGRYHSGWRKADKGMVYSITIPPNATARFKLPLLGKSEATVSESGKVVWKDGKVVAAIHGMGAAVEKSGALEIPLGSGTYEFEVF